MLHCMSSVCWCRKSWHHPKHVGRHLSQAHLFWFMHPKTVLPRTIRLLFMFFGKISCHSVSSSLLLLTSRSVLHTVWSVTEAPISSNNLSVEGEALTRMLLNAIVCGVTSWFVVIKVNSSAADTVVWTWTHSPVWRCNPSWHWSLWTWHSAL